MDCLHSGHVARTYGVKPHIDQSMLHRLALSAPTPGYVAAPPVLTNNATSTIVPLHHVLVGRLSRFPPSFATVLRVLGVF
jgi:hypothetical protein